MSVDEIPVKLSKTKSKLKGLHRLIDKVNCTV